MTPHSPSLSLCMIFKNEAAYIREAIESVLPLVNECILVDSKSNDGSEEIIADMKQKNPKIKYFLRDWPSDFSDQKNFAIEQASSDWILFLDADERIFEKDHAKIRSALSKPGVDAYNLPIRNYTRDVTEYGYQTCESSFADGFVLTHLHRLFKRHPQIRYSGILHERIEPSLETLGSQVEPLDATIHHLGPLKAKDLGIQKQRYEFYESLGRKKISAEPKNPQAHWELGVVLQKQRKLLEAEQKFEAAMKLDSKTEEFEVYYCMTLFQQGQWERLKKFAPRFRRSQMFQAVARAQTDPRAIDELDAYRGDFAQVALFIFELSLIHHRTDRLDRDRAEAQKLFAKSGLVEFLEKSAKRK